IANVIPSMDTIDKMLKPGIGSRTYHPAIQAAMKLGKATMNRYYSKTDLSNVYRITMVLHPGLELEYFCQHAWEANWIEEAKRLTHEEYHKHY
ncbi:hypothetical protein BKA93DRAFT_710194, partial [Sparassis latifolia]